MNRFCGHGLFACVRSGGMKSLAYAHEHCAGTKHMSLRT